MQKKILSLVLSLFLVSVTSIASADFFVLPLDIEIDTDDINLHSVVADDRGVAMGNGNDGNVIFTDELDADNILAQGGGNEVHLNDSIGRPGLWIQDEVPGPVYGGGLGGSQYYLNAGNVASQINIQDEFDGDISFSTAGNLVVHDFSLGLPNNHAILE